jgi:hypothetical protein
MLNGTDMVTVDETSKSSKETPTVLASGLANARNGDNCCVKLLLDLAVDFALVPRLRKGDFS